MSRPARSPRSMRIVWWTLSARASGTTRKRTRRSTTPAIAASTWWRSFRMPNSRGVGEGLGERLPGWEKRLHAVIAAAGDRAYKLGEHDCFRVACLDVEALTGVDLWAEW